MTLQMRRTFALMMVLALGAYASIVAAQPLRVSQPLQVEGADESRASVMRIDGASHGDDNAPSDPDLLEGADHTEGAPDQQLSEQQRQAQQRLLQEAAALRARLDQLGTTHGTYDPVLIEAQQDLGRTYLELEQFEDAVDHLTQALQLVRVNEGLYSDRQISVLRQLVAAHQGRQEWENVDDYQHLLFGVQSRLHDADAAGYVNALIAFSEWRLLAARHNLLARGGAQHNVLMLQEMQEQQDRALGTLQEHGPIRQQWDLLYTRALTDIELARQYNHRGLMEFVEPNEPRYVTRTVCSVVPDGPNGARRVCWNQTVNNPDYYRSAYNQQRNYLDRARSRVRSSLRQLDELLAENPDFASENAEDIERGMEIVQQVAADMQRDARRSALRRW